MTNFIFASIAIWKRLVIYYYNFLSPFCSSQLVTMLKASAAVQWLSHASQPCVFSSYYGKILSCYIYHKWFDHSEKEYDLSSSAWRQMFCYKTHKCKGPLDFGNLSSYHYMYIFKFSHSRYLIDFKFPI